MEGIYLKIFDTHNEYETYINSEDAILPNVSYCIDKNEVHYNPYFDPYNGYGFVDLGLPSGTLWATKNIGARDITDSGLYFTWGGTTGYTAEQVGVDKDFTWEDYELGDGSGGSSDSNLTKYNPSDHKTVLEPADDAAVVNMGGDWHMPTKAQFDELLNTTYVTNAWVTNYQGSGVNGRLFTSVADNTKTLFFPANGSLSGGVLYDFGNHGNVWSSMVLAQSQNYGNARDLSFDSTTARVTSSLNRCRGYSVRGVMNS